MVKGNFNENFLKIYLEKSKASSLLFHQLKVKKLNSEETPSGSLK